MAKSAKNDNKGLTLLEVMIALAVIGALLVTAVYTLNYHLGIADRHETLTVATMLGMDKFAELSASSANKEGSFEAPYQDYYYAVEAGESSSYAGISEVTVTVGKDREEVTLRGLFLNEEAWEGDGETSN